MAHTESHPMSGQTVKVRAGVKNPQLEGECWEYVIEDWWDFLTGGSWGDAQGNPACLIYAMRIGFSENPTPIDDEVVYGHIGHFGHLFHVSELEL